MKKTISILIGSLGSFFTVVAAIGVFAWLVRKASVLLQVIKS